VDLIPCAPSAGGGKFTKLIPHTTVHISPDLRRLKRLEGSEAMNLQGPTLGLPVSRDTLGIQMSCMTGPESLVISCL
jgi:hypothetical protein